MIERKKTQINTFERTRNVDEHFKKLNLQGDVIEASQIIGAALSACKNFIENSKKPTLTFNTKPQEEKKRDIVIGVVIIAALAALYAGAKAPKQEPRFIQKVVPAQSVYKVAVPSRQNS